VNRFQCLAVLSEKEALRYTPAGIPMQTVKLRHASNQSEAGIARALELEIAAIGAGEIAHKLSRAELGMQFLFSGFFAHKSRRSKGLLFHITDFEIKSIDE
jgi:primosomal replication protein N